MWHWLRLLKSHTRQRGKPGKAILRGHQLSAPCLHGAAEPVWDPLGKEAPGSCCGPFLCPPQQDDSSSFCSSTCSSPSLPLSEGGFRVCFPQPHWWRMSLLPYCVEVWFAREFVDQGLPQACLVKAANKRLSQTHLVSDWLEETLAFSQYSFFILQVERNTGSVLTHYQLKSIRIVPFQEEFANLSIVSPVALLPHWKRSYFSEPYL